MKTDRRPLTTKQILALRDVVAMTRFLGGISSGGQLTTGMLKSLEARGLVLQQKYLSALSDGDGRLIQPEKWRFAWEATEEGMKWEAR